MESAFSYFKTISEYAIDKSIKTKDYVINTVTDENFQENIKKTVSTGVTKFKDLSNSGIEYIQNPEFKDNIKQKFSNGIEYSKQKISNTIEFVQDPNFTDKIKENVKKFNDFTMEKYNSLSDTLNNEIILDFDNLTPGQINYLIKLSDEEVNRRFKENEIEIIKKLKEINEKKNKEEKNEKEEKKEEENNKEEKLENDENIEIELEDIN